MTDSSRYEYDWRRRLSHVNMTDSDLTKYDWWRRLGDGGSGDYTSVDVISSRFAGVSWRYLTTIRYNVCFRTGR